MAALDELASLTISAQSSPSSLGNCSNDDTPGTKLTDISPKGSENDQKAIVNVSENVSHPPSFAIPGNAPASSLNVPRGIMPVSDVHDPFTIDLHLPNPEGKDVGARLSPTAATFMPLWPTAARYSGGSLASIWLQPMPPNTAVGYLSATSTPDTESTQSYTDPAHSVVSTQNGSAMSPINPPAQSNTSGAAPNGVFLSSKMNFSTAGSTTRYLKINQVLKTATIKELNIAFNVPPLKLVYRILSTDKA